MLSYSTLGLPDVPFSEQCALLKTYEYGGVEIALTPAQIARRGDAAYWREIATTAQNAGLAITNLHLGNPRLYADPSAPRLLNRDSRELNFHLELVRAMFEIAEHLRCPLATTASGAPVAGMDDAESWERLLNSLREVTNDTPDGCQFLIEHEPEHFIRSTDQIIRLFNETAGKVACNLDVGHLEVAGEPLGDSIRSLGTIIRNVHLEDIKDRVHKHLLPGDGDINFQEIADALKEIGYQGPMTVDLYPYAKAPIPALESGQRVSREHFEVM